MFLFQTLKRKQKIRSSFKYDNEYRFFLENRHLLNKFNKYVFLFDTDNEEFDVFRVNIILHGIINMQTIENEVKVINEVNPSISEEEFNEILKERISELPYFNEKGHKIYIPFFSRAINDLYVREPKKLLQEPYASLHEHFEASSVDPFDTYRAEIYNSYFTRLIQVGSNGREYAYFHYETKTIYIVNNQGRLDESIILFDRYIRRPNYEQMIERIKPVVERYFSNDREGFIKALFDSNFISNKVYSILIKK